MVSSFFLIFYVLYLLIMITKQANPNTKKIRSISGTLKKIRISKADRSFLKDLSRLQILSRELVSQSHYQHLKGGVRRSLARLEEAGIIRSEKGFIPGRGVTTLYQFSSLKMAKAWGGTLPSLGAKRNELHELITSELYYLSGKPEDFRLANRLTDDELIAFNGHRPDAVFTDLETGEPVAVEADSGHYNKQQIMKKLVDWKNCRQVWGQAARGRSVIPSLSYVDVHVLH